MRLPSGNLWATKYVGTGPDAPYGKLFSWGAVSGKSYSNKFDLQYGEEYLDWSTYLFSREGGMRVPNLIKYCNSAAYGYDGFVDNLSILELRDDAAHVIMGGGWVMPTEEDIRELQSSCSAKYVSDAAILTSRYNGAQLKLPFSFVGGYADIIQIWSSSLIASDCQNAFVFYATMDGGDGLQIFSHGQLRYYSGNVLGVLRGGL